MKDRDNAVFNSIPQTPNLRAGLADNLIAQIESGDLKPGQRLPDGTSDHGSDRGQPDCRS